MRTALNEFLSKTAAHVANARTVKLADGRELSAGSSFDAGPKMKPARRSSWKG